MAENQPTVQGRELAGSLPMFSSRPGGGLASGLTLPNFDQKRLLLNQLGQPGEVHVYRAECHAGERLRAQMFVPALPLGGSVVPAFALVAQSLPYSADVHKLPIDVPAGYSAVVAPPPNELLLPVQDTLTRARYYPGPTVDTRTLVSGHCYIVVWSPHNHMGKYMVQLGHRWPMRWTYWLQVPRFWWQIRGWYGLSRTAAYVAGTALLLGGALAWHRARHRARRRQN